MSALADGLAVQQRNGFFIREEYDIQRVTIH